MKKVLISVFAVVLILGANMALADSFPLELDRMPKELARIWKAITRLEEQIREIELTPGPQGEQGIQGEVGPQGPQGVPGSPVNILDANNVVIGSLLDYNPNGFLDFWDTARKRKVHIYSRSVGPIEIYDGEIGTDLLYTEPNCQGDAYRISGGGSYPQLYPTQIYKMNFPSYTQYGWEYVKTESFDIYSGSIMVSMWHEGACQVVNPGGGTGYSKVIPATPIIYTGPLSIE